MKVWEKIAEFNDTKGWNKEKIAAECYMHKYCPAEIEEDYHFIGENRPCPKCGQSLLTKEDLETIKIIICIVNIINWVTKPFSFLFKNEKTKNYTVEMNGTGSVNFKRID